MPRPENRLPATLLIVLAFFCVASFFLPAFIIRPFRYQSPGALSLAMQVRSIAPIVASACVIGMLLLVIRLWGAVSRLARVGLAFLLLLGAAAAIMTRLNYFEWMFRPIQAAGFLSTDKVRFSDQEMVMAVKVGTDARAYPIRQMAYHHVLNDTVAGMPVVVTY